MAKAAKNQAHQIGATYIEQMIGADKGKLTDLSMDIMSIGRAPDNDIIFPSESVSRCHAFLKRTPTGWLLQDNQSKNGIKKNGEKVLEAPLHNGDVVQIGDFVFKFVEPGQTTGEPTAAATRSGSMSGATNTARLRMPRPAPTAAPNPAVDEAFRSLSRPRMNWNWSMIQFGGGIAALVIISVLIGFKLRNMLTRHDAEVKKAAGITAAGDAAAPIAPPPVAAATAAPKAPVASKAPIPQEPIDQNNPNEGRVVSEEVIDAHAVGTPDNALTNLAANSPPSPGRMDTPPPPPLALNDGLSKKDLQIKTQKVAGRNVTKDLGVYLQEGRDYLKEGDFESAALAFRFALVIDPTNRTAIDGIRAAEYRKKEIPAAAQPETAAPANSPPSAAAPPSASASARQAAASALTSGVARQATAPSESAPPPAKEAPSYADSSNIPLPPGDRKQQVRTLLKTAQVALNKRSYQEAINNAERARRIEIRGETAYLNEAKQIIDRAKLKQKDDFDPFIARAKEKLKAGDYAGSKMLCEEMLRTDPAYSEARECVSLANEGLKGKK